MARLSGVDLPRDKRVEVALTYIYGIGRTRALQTLDATTGASLTDKSAWRDLLPPVRLLPDTPHRFRVTGQPATHVRLNIFPDGGVARLRLYGSLTDAGLATACRRWEETA